MAPQARAAACFLFVLGFAAPAFAYLDPATGNAFLQVVLAGLLAVGYAFKSYWLKLKDLFRSKKGKLEGRDPAASDPKP